MQIAPSPAIVSALKVTIQDPLESQEAIDTHGLTLPVYAAYCQFKVNIAHQEYSKLAELKDLTKLNEGKALKKSVQDKYAKILAKEAAPGDFLAIKSNDRAAQLEWLISKVNQRIEHLWKILEQEDEEESEVEDQYKQATAIQRELHEENPLPPKPSPQSIKLLIKDLIRNARQSSGTSSIVDGTYVHGGISLEVKVKLKKRERLEEVEHEYNIMYRLHNKYSRFFIRSYELLKNWEGNVSSVSNEDLSNYCCIVMEKGDESLTDYLAREHNNMTRISSLFIVEKLVDILIAAHEENIVLMDFKPCNIIHCADNNWKTIDFDDSKEAGEMVNDRCTASYASFEMAKYFLNKNPSCKSLPASKAMDICSLGWMVWKIMNHNKSLWEEKGIEKNEDAILHMLSTMTDEDMMKNINYAFPGEVNAPLRHWLEDALKIDPFSRPAAKTLKTNYSLLGHKEGTKNMDSFVRRVEKIHLSLLERIDTLSKDLMDKFSFLEESLDQEAVHLALNSQMDAFNHLMRTLEGQRKNAQGNNLQVDQLMLRLKETGADIKEAVIASIAQVLSSESDHNASQSDKLDSILQMMHGMKEQMNEIASLNQHQLSLLGELGLKNNFMPHLFCIIPEVERQTLDRNATVVSKVVNWSKRKAESIQRCVWARSRLIFICPVTAAMVPCGLDGKGYVLCIPHEWVQTAVPILKIGWLLLKVALATQGLGTVIPNINDFLPQTFNKDTLDALFDTIATPADERDSSAIDSMMEESQMSFSALEHLFKLIARAEDCDIESNAALLTSWKPAKTGLHLTLCKKTGQSAWVSADSRVAYQKQGNESFEQVVAAAGGV